jgi:hypothetical protein
VGFGGSLSAASYFEVTIEPENRSFGNSGRQCVIQAGMDAKADIISSVFLCLFFKNEPFLEFSINEYYKFIVYKKQKPIFEFA